MDAKLVMFKSNGQRKDFPIISPKTVIGRGDNCDLRVPLLSVSRQHCELTLAKRVRVRDLGSSNGTYVNNRRVNETALKAGDRLAVGPIVFTMQIDGVPEEIRPVKTRAQRMAQEGEPGAEEIIELEDDVIAQPGASALEEGVAAGAAAGDDEEVVDLDPISALEALAADKDDEEDK